MYKKISFHETYLIFKTSVEKYKFDLPENNTRLFSSLLEHINSQNQSQGFIDVTIEEAIIDNTLYSEGFDNKTFTLFTNALLTDPDNNVYLHEISFVITLNEINQDIFQRSRYFENTSEGFIKARMIRGRITKNGFINRPIEDDQ